MAVYDSAEIVTIYRTPKRKQAVKENILNRLRHQQKR